MKRLAMVLWTAALMTPFPAAADTPYVCGTGMLRDVEAITERIATPQHTQIRTKTNKRGERETRVETSPGERENRFFRLVVQLDDMEYTSESSGNLPWNFDPTRLVINDPIGLCVAKNQLILRRPDGKDYKAKIVRVMRAPKAAF